MNRSDIALLNRKLGTNFALDSKIAMDADYVGGTAITAPNGDVPAFLTTWIDPAFIDVLVAPMRMAEIFPEVQKGDRVTSSVQFAVRELNGETSTYGDFNDNGVSGSNVNWVARQPYEYQTHVKIGSKAQEVAAAARYDLVSSEIEASMLALNKFQNLSYIYGVDGLQNYGLLNDPSLLPDITGIDWEAATAEQVFAEIQKLYTQLVKQSNGLVKLRDSMTLLLSPVMETHLTKINTFGISVYDMLKKTYANLKIESIPEYSTAAGEKIQLILDSYLGRNTVELAFNTKLSVGAVEVKTTGFLQKRSQGTLGAMVYYPVFIVGMLAQNGEA